MGAAVLLIALRFVLFVVDARCCYYLDGHSLLFSVCLQAGACRNGQVKEVMFTVLLVYCA